MFVREPQDVWIKKRAVFHCKAKFAKWLFFRCENILGLKFKVTAGRSNTTLAAKMRIYRGQLMGEHTEATCYCQAIGRGAAIQHSRLARIRLTEGLYWYRNLRMRSNRQHCKAFFYIIYFVYLFLFLKKESSSIWASLNVASLKN